MKGISVEPSIKCCMSDGDGEFEKSSFDTTKSDWDEIMAAEHHLDMYAGKSMKWDYTELYGRIYTVDIHALTAHVSIDTNEDRL